VLSSTSSRQSYSPPAEALGVVDIDVADTTLRLALCFVAEDSGWQRGPTDDRALLVSTRARAGTTVHVLVVEPRPADCKAAIEAVASGRALAILCADEPDRLAMALDAARAGFALIPGRVIAAANAAPTLDGRLRETLSLVAAGNSNASIARTLHESESTAKRDVATLMRLFDVTSRRALAGVAAQAGYYRP
jgi:DNA-binding NarL/FixJ family response regulator